MTNNRTGLTCISLDGRKVEKTINLKLMKAILTEENFIRTFVKKANKTVRIESFDLVEKKVPKTGEIAEYLTFIVTLLDTNEFLEMLILYNEKTARRANEWLNNIWGDKDNRISKTKFNTFLNEAEYKHIKGGRVC